MGHICISKHEMCDLLWLSHEVAMYFNIYSYLYNDYDYDTNFHVMVMLRSTTDPYGRSCDSGRIWGDNTFTLPRLYGR